MVFERICVRLGVVLLNVLLPCAQPTAAAVPPIRSYQAAYLLRASVDR